MTDKKQFLKTEFIQLVSNLQPEQKGKWGRMNAQQMVEHMCEYIRIASGKQKMKPELTPELTQRAYAFMMTERPFRENTPNSLMPDVPAPFKHATMAEALDELQTEIDDFFTIYAQHPAMQNMNPFFGNLNFEEQVQLMHKHAMHHARQFGLVE